MRDVLFEICHKKLGKNVCSTVNAVLQSLSRLSSITLFTTRLQDMSHTCDPVSDPVECKNEP